MHNQGSCEWGLERTEIYYSGLSQWAVSDNDDEYLLDKYLPKSGSDCLRFSPSTGDPLEKWFLLVNVDNNVDNVVLIRSV